MIRRVRLFYVGSFVVLAVVLTALASCVVNYSFTGARIHPDAKTVSIPFFPNQTTLASPTLSSSLTEALQDRFVQQTKLALTRDQGDLHFEGEITNYTETPVAVSAEDQMASRNRVTITVRVRFTNRLEPEYSFTDKSFSQYLEYDTRGQSLMNVQQALDAEIIEMLVDDIFNAAVSSW